MISNFDSLYRELSRKAVGSGIPLFGGFEITGRCNFDCKMCYVHTCDNAMYLKNERPGSWWIEQIDKAISKGMLIALISGGECLLHPDFEEIFTHLRKNGVRVGINTNGFLITDRLIDFFKEQHVDKIQISLYGSNDDTYEKVTGRRTFSKVKENIIKLKNAGLPVKIAITPSVYNFEDVANTVELAKSLGVSYDVNAYLVSSVDSDEHNRQDINASIDDYIKMYKSYRGVTLHEVDIDTLPPTGGSSKESPVGYPCKAGKLHFWLTWDGYMQPCSVCFDYRIPYTDFDESWEEIKDIMNNVRAPLECEGCAYRKVCFGCTLHRSDENDRSHCNPAVCALTKRKVEEGLTLLK